MVALEAGTWRLDAVEAVLFDKDGTIVDSHHYWGAIVQRRALRLAEPLGGGAELVAGLVRAMGYDTGLGRLVPEGPVGLEPREVVVGCVEAHLAQAGCPVRREVIEATFVDVHAEMLAEVSDLVRPIPGAISLITTLHELGVPLAVVTTDALATTRAALELLGIADRFQAIVGRESCPQEKATGVPARLALEALRVPARRAVCIGDAPMDALMASRSGCLAAIGVATGQVDAEHLRAYTPHVVASLSLVTACAEAPR